MFHVAYYLLYPPIVNHPKALLTNHHHHHVRIPGCGHHQLRGAARAATRAERVDSSLDALGSAGWKVVAMAGKNGAILVK